MASKLECRQYRLTLEAIDQISEYVGEYMESIKSARADVLRVRMAVEEMLIRLNELTEDPIDIEVCLGKKHRRHMLYVSYKGSELNPTETEEGMAWSSQILEGIGLLPTWSYRSKCNRISFALREPPRRNSLIYLLIAVALSIIVGVSGRIIPEDIRTGIDESILSPMMSAFLGLLKTFAGFMVAFTISSGIIGMGNSETVGRIGKHVVLRYVFLSLIVAIVVMVVVRPFFGVDIASTSGGGMSQFKSIAVMIFDILPKDPISPFLEGNTIQVIVIAVILSICLILLDDKVLRLKTLVEEGALLLQRAMSVVCGLVPIFVFAALSHQIWMGYVSVFAKLWKPMCLSIGASALFSFVSLLGVSWKQRCSPVRMIKKLMPPFLTALTTASSVSAFSKSMSACEKECGVDKTLLQFSYPIGGVIYMPSTVTSLCIMSYAMAEVYNIQISIAWIVLAIITAVLLAIAAPPVPGAGLMLYTILFAQLGIPAEAILLSTAYEMIFDYPETGFNVLYLLVETVDEAGRLKKLDKKKLAA